MSEVQESELQSFETVKSEIDGPGRTLKGVGAIGLRVAGCLLAAGVVTAPSSLEYGIEHAQVVDTIGEFPTTFTYTGNGMSRLKAAGMNAYLPVNKMGIGIKADVEGFPPTEDISQFFSVARGKALVSQYSDPEAAARGYQELLAKDMRSKTQDKWVDSTLLLGGAMGVLLVGGRLVSSRYPRREQLPLKIKASMAAGGIAAAAITNGAVAYQNLKVWGEQEYVPTTTYRIGQLQNTYLEDLTVGSLIEKDVAENIVPTIEKFTTRQAEINETFSQDALTSLEAASQQLVGPSSDEEVTLFYSDMHSNTIATQFMADFVSGYKERFPEALKVVISAGDNTFGTGGEVGAIEAQAAAAGDTPIVGIAGNHDSSVTQSQMDNAGIEVLDNEVVEIEDIRILGSTDPVLTPLFRANVSREDASERLTSAEQQELQYAGGQQAREIAETEEPDVYVTHEKSMAGSFMQVEDMDRLMEGDSLLGVGDVPAGVVVFGHEHDEQEPTVIYNSDGSWTLVIELGTAGGAIENPTYAHYSFPTAPPKKIASFMLVMRNKESGLPTGYQRVQLYPTAEVNVNPYVAVGKNEALAQKGMAGVNAGKNTKQK